MEQNSTKTVWNERRMDGIDLSGKILEWGDFTAVSFRNADFTGCRLSNSRFRDCDLERAKFAGQICKGRTFGDAVLKMQTSGVRISGFQHWKMQT